MKEQLLQQVQSYEQNTRTTLIGNILSGGILLFFYGQF